MVASSTHCSVSRLPLPLQFCAIFRSCLRLRWQLSFRLPVTRRRGAFSSLAFSNFCWSPAMQVSTECWQDSVGPSLTPMCGNFSARSVRQFSVQPACNSRYSQTQLLQVFCRRAHCLHFIMPTGSINCRSALSALPPAPLFFPKCHAALPAEITEALRTRRIALSNSHFCCRFRVSRHFSSSPI